MIKSCLLTLMDSSSFQSWGRHVYARNTGWALAHDFTPILQKYYGSTWEIPIRVNELLHHGGCSRIMYLDGDALISNISWNFPSFTDDILFTSHNANMAINTGVFFVSNTRVSRQIFDWWSNYGNLSCSKVAQWPEQTCAQKIPSIWNSTRVRQDPSINYGVDIFKAKDYPGLSQVMQKCVSTQNICHPYGTKFWCKHRREKNDTLTMCMHKARVHLFSDG